MYSHGSLLNTALHTTSQIIAVQQSASEISPSIRMASFQFAHCAKGDCPDVKKDSKGAGTTKWLSPSTGDKLDQRRSRSHIRSQSHTRIRSHTNSRNRVHSPAAPAVLKCRKDLESFLGTEVAAQNTPLQQPSQRDCDATFNPGPRIACKFSYEDYKHSQTIGWLEGEVVDKVASTTFPQ